MLRTVVTQEGQPRIVLTLEGGVGEVYTNKTGAASIAGTVVKLSAASANAVEVSAAGEFQPIGVVYDAPWNVGVADGGQILVITEGNVKALLEDGTESTAGNWVKTSDTAPGRVDASNAAPPGGGIPELEEHMRELGHSEQTISSGIDVLCEIHLHLN